MLHQLRLDAAENAFFLRELENVEARLYETSYPELKYDRLIPTENGFDPGALSLIYRELRQVGGAKVISDKSKRLPRVDIVGTENATPVKPLGASFGYSIQELKAAAKVGRSLDQARANAARESILRLLDSIAAIGDSESGIKGLLNHSSVTGTTAPATGTGSSTHWHDKTAALILDDLNLGVSTIRGNTLGVEAPDTLLLPEAEYTRIAQLRADTTSDLTVLKFFLATNPWVKNVEPWHYLSTAGGGSTQRMFFYRRDPSKVKLRNPGGYEQLPPQEDGLEFVVPCWMTTAGIIFYKPLSAYYLDGI